MTTTATEATTSTGPDERFLVVGFDLGHGETAVATLWADSGGEPIIAQLPGTSRWVHPTAVALCANAPGQTPYTLVGASCFTVEPHRVLDIIPPDPDGKVADGAAPEADVPAKELYLAFKSSDLGPESRTRRAVELFVGRIVRDLMEAGPNPSATNPPSGDLPDGRGASRLAEIPAGTTIRWVFGVPSGWAAADYLAYQDLLSEVVNGVSPGQQVEVIPESRAALLYGQRSQDLFEDEREAIRSAGGRTTVLVIDMGSSTTDYTFVAGLREQPVDDGDIRLGAALIEQQLLRWTIAKHPDSARLAKAVERDNYQLLRLEYACRKAKEQFFVNESDDYAPSEGLRWLGGEDVVSASGERFDVPIRISAQAMDEILDTPLAELGHQSWREAFRRELERVREDILDEHGSLPDVVLLTGGASRMGFAQELCRAAFGQSEDGGPGSRLVRGHEPEYAIAKGLAVAGQTRHRVDSFLDEVDAFIAGELPALVRGELDALAASLGEVMVGGMVEEQVCPAVLKWRRGEIRLLSGIATDVTIERERYVKSAEGRAKTDAVISAWYSRLTRSVNRRTTILANLREIPSQSLDLAPIDTVRTSVQPQVDAAPTLQTLDVIANVSAGMMSVTAAAAGAAVGAAGMAASTAAAAVATAGGAAAASNPIGWVIGPVLAVVAAVAVIWVGKEALMEKAEKADIPDLLRKAGFEKTLLAKVKRKASDDGMEAAAAAKYAEDFKSEHGEEIVASLSESARRAALLVDRAVS